MTSSFDVSGGIFFLCPEDVFDAGRLFCLLSDGESQYSGAWSIIFRESEESMTIKPIIPLNVMAVDPARRVSPSTAVVSNLNDSSSTKKTPLVVKPVTVTISNEALNRQGGDNTIYARGASTSGHGAQAAISTLSLKA